MGMRSGAKAALALTVVAAVCVTAPAAAGAAGGYLTFNRDCPADDPAMLASPAGAYTGCVALASTGDAKFGNLQLRVSAFPDFGVQGPTATDLSVVPTTAPQQWSAQANGTPLTPLVPVCDALLLLIPRSDPNGIRSTCLALARSVSSDVLLTFRIEPAGAPSDLKLSGLIGGGPAMTLPVKVHLISPALGPACYIGSNANPIRLRLVADSALQYHDQRADDNGFPVSWDRYYGSGQRLADTSFAVPAAAGCGGGALDWLVNALLGLPAPGGNSISLGHEVTIQSTTAGGAVLSQAYHASFE
jgi:hypothetical protein